MNTQPLIEKVLTLKNLFNKSIEDELSTYEMELYTELFYDLKSQKFKDIEDYRLKNLGDYTSTTTKVVISKKEKVEVSEEDMLTDIFDEMEITLKQIHQKFINEGELDVDDVLLFDSIYPQLKKNGYYVEKYKIR